MKTSHTLGMIAAALVLSACGSAGRGLGGALLSPFDPKPGGYATLNLGGDNGNAIIKKDETIRIHDAEKGGTKSYNANDKFDISHKKQNKITSLGFELLNANKQKVESGELDIYKLSYSAVVGKRIQKRFDGTTGEEIKNFNPYFTVESVQGRFTKEAEKPKGGIVNYQGIAFAGQDNQGRLNYNINFGNNTGSGTITGLKGEFHKQTIELAQADLTKRSSDYYGLSGDAKINGNNRGEYHLNLFGPKADEVAGRVNIRDLNQNTSHSIGIGGKRTN